MATDWSVTEGIEAWVVSIDLIGFSTLDTPADQTAWRTALLEAARRGLLSKNTDLTWATFLGDEIRVAFDAGEVDFDGVLDWCKSVLRRLWESSQYPKPVARAFILGPGKVLGEEMDSPHCRYLDGPLSAKVDTWAGCKPKLSPWHIAISRNPGSGANRRKFESDDGWVLAWPEGQEK